MESNPKKYSDMLVAMVDEFENFLPEELTFEDTIEIGIEAWNLANNTTDLDDALFLSQVKKHRYRSVIEKMVGYKLKHFSDFTNVIVDYSTDGDLIQVKHITQKNHLDSFIGAMLKGMS
ncbi:hypothetical protein M3O96_09825 [Aquiflexum sp. TKW24L]|uniref:hypothetical protein n=1 Tax=Aquiflexum sp. TKW24L TaxID=2942212 RepID=UPI0020BF44C5|nr:hypothetical protein [Aquiflexum sp. TKW24L]MCL6259387.1 hypothetical protein [Aquiflexum sp. TKW24L]